MLFAPLRLKVITTLDKYRQIFLPRENSEQILKICCLMLDVDDASLFFINFVLTWL